MCSYTETEVEPKSEWRRRDRTRYNKTTEWWREARASKESAR